MKTYSLNLIAAKSKVVYGFRLAFICAFISLLPGCDKEDSFESSRQSDSQAAQESSRQNTITIPSACCTDYPLKLTAGAGSMVEALKNLVSGFGAKNCHPGITSVTAAMPAKYYLNSQLPGIITFGIFYRNDGVIGRDDDSDNLRFTWSSASDNALGYTYYGVCVPEPIIFPAGLGENHVYAAKLIPVRRYQALNAPVVDINNVRGIRIADIAEVVNVFIEEKSGYMATKESASYNHPSSSKGVVVVVKLKSNQQVLCYLINNYDDGTILWKERNTCAGL